MALLTLQQVQASELVAEYFADCRRAEERRTFECGAVGTIQAYARGFLVRSRLQRLTCKAITIQRWWRGYLGRMRGRLALEAYNRVQRKAYFYAMATVIQRWWRGFHSRKNIHDYYARRRYLQQVKERNTHIRAELNLEAERAIIRQRQEAEERARKLFADKVSKLHHLVSTFAQPGIFNSPYSVATGTLPVIMGMPVEDHLKTAMRTQLSATHGSLAGGGGTGSLNGSSRLPPLRSGTEGGSQQHGSPSGRRQRTGDVPYPATAVVAGRTVPARHTLRQAADYEAVHRQALIEEKIHRGEMLSQHPQAFTTALGSAVKAPLFDLQSNRNLLPFADSYDPTVGLRGPRFTPDQRKISPAAFGRYLKRQPVFDKSMAEAY